MYHLTKEDEAKVLQGWEEHETMCGCDAGHGVACAAARVFHHGGSNKRLLEKSYEVCAATALFLIMEKRLTSNRAFKVGDKVCVKVAADSGDDPIRYGTVEKTFPDGCFVRIGDDVSLWPVSQLVRV